MGWRILEQALTKQNVNGNEWLSAVNTVTILLALCRGGGGGSSLNQCANGRDEIYPMFCRGYRKQASSANSISSLCEIKVDSRFDLSYRK